MQELPSGTVTLLFTDIEGSTRLLRELGERYADALAEHRRVLRDAFARHGGVEVDTQGDAFFVAFQRATDAISAAAEAQQTLDDVGVRVRMGVHTGEPSVTGEGYVGLDVHRAARICAVGHGGQVLVSQTTRTLLDDAFDLCDLGQHRLKDLVEPLRLYQLGNEQFPPLKTLHRTNLPVPATALVGRFEEIDSVVSLIRRDDVRLLTLAGPGGTGKTRLAVQAAAELVDEYEDGTFFVGLAPLADAQLLESTIAQTLEARDDLADHLSAKHMLLVLDNFEHLLEGAPTVARLLAAAPALNVLVTSREPLRIEGEREYPVPPLAAREAVELFRERALEAEPVEVVAEICRRLDHLPLAIELAAARTRALSPTKLLERLEHRLPLLTGGAKDASERQRTLRATIEWSYEPLGAEERRLFRDLAVFAGGCTLEAAEAICSAHLDPLESLVQKSLVRHTGDRFWMLETIREYALEGLNESDEVEAVRRRHAEHYAEIAESANLSIDAVGRGMQRHELVLPEQHNLRAAIDWAAEADVELGLRLAIALENFWITHDPTEGVRRFEALLDRAGDIDLLLHARALRDYGGCADMAGDYERGRPAYAQSGELFREAGDESGAATAVYRLGVIAARVGDFERARQLWEESLETFRRLRDSVGELQALGNLGWLEFEQGDPKRGWELTETSLEMAREAGWVWSQVGFLRQLAEQALVAGRAEEGERRAREFLRLAHEIEDRPRMVYGLAFLAWAAAERGDAERAAVLWAAAEAEEAKGPMAEWQADRERYAVHIPEAPKPTVVLALDEAVEYALSA